ncbi:hypothetical protein JCM8097_003331 [Rhodosporidiobolus ruineniae]
MPTEAQIAAARAEREANRLRGAIMGPLDALLQDIGGGGGWGGAGSGGGGGGAGLGGRAGAGPANGGGAAAGGAGAPGGGAAGGNRGGGGFGGGFQAAGGGQQHHGGGGGGRAPAADDAHDGSDGEGDYGGGFDGGDAEMLDSLNATQEQSDGGITSTAEALPRTSLNNHNTPSNPSPASDSSSSSGAASSASSSPMYKRARSNSSSATSVYSSPPHKSSTVLPPHLDNSSPSHPLLDDPLARVFQQRQTEFTTRLGLAAMRVKYGLYAAGKPIDLAGHEVIDWLEIPPKVDADEEKKRLLRPKNFADPVTIIRLRYSYASLKTQRVKNLKILSPDRIHTYSGDVVVVSSDEIPIAYHGQQALTMLLGGNVKEAKRVREGMSEEMKALVDHYGIDAPCVKDARHQAPQEGYAPGSGLEHLICWPELGHPNPANMKPSRDFCKGGKSDTLTRTMSYGRVLAANFELVAAFAAAIDPSHYLTALLDYEAKLAGSHYDRLIGNPSHFHQGLALLHNLRVLPHLDGQDEEDGWAFMTPLGFYKGGELVLRQFGLRFLYQPGDIVALRSSFIFHEVEDYDGYRQSMVFFSRQAFRDIPAGAYMDWQGFKRTGIPRFGPARQTKQERAEKMTGVKKEEVYDTDIWAGL